MSNSNNILDKKKKRKLYEIRVYTHTENLRNENIMGRIKRNQNDISAYGELLNEEETIRKKKKTNNKSSKENEEENEKSEKQLSETSAKIISDVNDIISNMNQSTEELKKLNALFLIETSKKINKTNLQSQNLPKINNNQSINQETKDEQLIEENEKNKKNNKKSKPINFTYINDNYRKQLNRAFMNFNPIIHLGNLNLLRKADPSINEDIQKLEKHIDDDLKTIIDPYYYKHQYEKLLKEHEKLKKRINTAPTLQTDNYNNNTNNYTNYNNYNNANTTFRRRRKNKLEIKRKFPDKDLRIKELKNMNDCLIQISKSINNDNINHYYNDYEILKNYSIEQQAHNYFPDIRKANDIMREIQQDKLIRGLNQETKLKKKYVDGENNRIVDQISKSKDLLLKEIGEIEKK